ncbi:MAG TPA: carboxymuconolactone decarboxylase family protein [Methanocorpusculum sp.]|nr:carboxymuconolactone decarboxylase family protein [Methanocorpusculum sp.]MCQ2376517.1 carboxymuconolactone decarboxylase family protein [Methanocorpusculum sp.]HJJ32887.1 carboxymuconolactone decarboxylase family protein [Methanocorpusculum sp.]HJJ44771.1 carboxymuconolactone decarboxylase family protein [Methanocorpusculum sp.]HJJ58703.1 carboxymuconolactone decarboxylase family protein [Methanocorpusculum sp.]
MVDINKDFENAILEIKDKGAEKTAADWLEDVEEEFGSAPLIYKKLEACPEALLSHMMYKHAVNSLGALDAKTVELISLAVGAALRCDHCTTYHMHVAQKMGISKEEILETVLIAGLLSNSSVLAHAYRVVTPDKEKEEPCGAACSIK